MDKNLATENFLKRPNGGFETKDGWPRQGRNYVHGNDEKGEKVNRGAGCL